MVLVQEEFCSGGSLQDHLKLLLGAGSRGPTRTGGRGGRGDLVLEVDEEEKTRQSGAKPCAAALTTGGGNATGNKPLQAAAGLRGENATAAARLEVWVRQVNLTTMLP